MLNVKNDVTGEYVMISPNVSSTLGSTMRYSRTLSAQGGFIVSQSEVGTDGRIMSEVIGYQATQDSAVVISSTKQISVDSLNNVIEDNKIFSQNQLQFERMEVTTILSNMLPLISNSALRINN